MPDPGLCLFQHTDCQRHASGGWHPENPHRLAAIDQALAADPVLRDLPRVTASPAGRASLERVHSARYLDALASALPASGVVWLDNDTYMNPASLEACYGAAGAVILAVDQVLGGDCRRAFSLVRPPGHHAGPEQPMGFCLINVAAVGIAHALAQPGIRRVAVVDFDVHRGNGTEAIFHDDPRVLFCSGYQEGLLPATESGSKPVALAETRFPAHAEGDALREAWDARWAPALAAFEPDLVFVSAGFDAHTRDPLGGLHWRDEDFGWLGERLAEFADRTCHGRLVATLEGGYEPAALKTAVPAFLRALA